ncbi:hypothetical protein [Methylobacterium oryzae]|uniref:hypothetical protein n=1 Tax=Methylobacterium oryzae TaxID=334852 RepID=UPI002F358FF6
MSTNPPSGQVLLTLDDARRLKEERDAVAREYEALGQRLDRLNKQVEALALFLPAHVHERLFEPTQEGGRPRKWAPVIFRMLEDAGHGLTTSDIKEGLKGTDLETEIGPHGNSLYNALSKMTLKGELLRERSYYCLPGQQPPANASGRPGARQIDLDVVRVLSSKPSGLKSMEIVQEILRAQMPSSSGMQKSTGGFYKALSLLVAAGKVTKQGHLYKLPHHENEPSDGGASDGSDAGSDDERPRTLRLV